MLNIHIHIHKTLNSNMSLTLWDRHGSIILGKSLYQATIDEWNESMQKLYCGYGTLLDVSKLSLPTILDEIFTV